MWMADAKAKQDIPLDGLVIPIGSKITITKNKNNKYQIWGHDGIYHISEEFFEDVKVIVES